VTWFTCVKLLQCPYVVRELYPPGHYLGHVTDDSIFNWLPHVDVPGNTVLTLQFWVKAVNTYFRGKNNRILPAFSHSCEVRKHALLLPIESDNTWKSKMHHRYNLLSTGTKLVSNVNWAALSSEVQSFCN